MEIIIIILASFLYSTAAFIFWVSKGGFNKRFLYTDNIVLALAISGISIAVYKITGIGLPILLLIISPAIGFSLFVILFLYRFFRNPSREITSNADEIVSPADGRVIYIKELEKGQIPVSVKKYRLASIEEITKTPVPEQPCYLIGIAMTLFDVHMNRAPISGKVIMVKHTPGVYLGLNKPESTVVNERNTIVIEREDGIMAAVIQIAARYVRRCIISVGEGEAVTSGAIIGKIRWGSQADLVIPRNCEIMVREGEQVYAGETIIAKLLKSDA
jgi:phosphatidylserine decarboxylase